MSLNPSEQEARGLGHIKKGNTNNIAAGNVINFVRGLGDVVAIIAGGEPGAIDHIKNKDIASGKIENVLEAIGYEQTAY